MSDFEQELSVLIRARYPLIYLQTAEESRAEEILKQLAQGRGKRLYVWTLTRGYEPPIPAPTEAATSRPLAPELEAIAQLLRLQDDALVVLKDFHPYLSDARVIRLLRDLYPRCNAPDAPSSSSRPSLSCPLNWRNKSPCWRCRCPPARKSPTRYKRFYWC
jgi:hypothetical protein